MKTRTISMAAAVLGLSVACGTAFAAPTFVYGLETAPGGTVTGAPAAARLTLEGKLVLGSAKSDGVSGPAGPASSARLGGIDATAQADALPPGVDFNTYGPGIFNDSGSGRFDTSGNGQWWETATSFSVVFDSGKAAKAFGFYVTDAGDFNGTFNIQLIQAGQILKTYDILALAKADPDSINDPGSQPNNGANNGWLEFFGFYDAQTAYSEVRFNILQGSDNPDDWDFLGFDSFLVGDVPPPTDIPEPGSLALVGLSLLGLAAVRRRRQA